MLKITQAPSQPIYVKRPFTIAGIASPEQAGKTLTFIVDNRFNISGAVVHSDGSWQIELVFQQSGERSLKISTDRETVELVLQLLPLPTKVYFTTTSQTIETKETILLRGQAEGYDEGTELVLLADGRYEIARPRIKNNQWQAYVFFHQSGQRLIEIIAPDQKRDRLELNVQPGTLNIVTRSVWINEFTPEDVSDLDPQRITIHHTEYPTLSSNASQSVESQRMRQIRQFHIDKPPAGRGWSDIAYHFVIMPSGRIYEARYQRKRGAHDRVNDGIGIAFDGNYTSQRITQAQFDSAVALCTKIFKRYKLGDPTILVPTLTADFGIKDLPRICAHQDRAATACPGTSGGRTVRLEEIRRAVKSRI